MAMKYILQIIFGLLLTTTAASAADLLTVYQQALQTDPTLLQAQAIRDANFEALPQSRALLLPNLAGSAQTNAIRLGNQADPNNSVSHYNQHDYQLILSQPLFNLSNWIGLSASKAKVKQAKATYRSAVQNLIIRSATAYFNVLQAQDLLAYTQAQQKSVSHQLTQIKQKYEVGLTTMTAVYQAQANNDQLKSQVITAQNNLNNNLQALQQITGVNYQQLAPLRKNLPLLTPNPDNVTPWIIAAEKYNQDLLAQRYAAAAAKASVHQNFANHFPTVDAVGAYQKGNDVNSLTNEQWRSQVGVQLNVPLYAGGLVNSQTRQAQDQYIAASDQIEITHRQVIFNVKQAFNNIMAGISKVRADRVAVISAQSALASIQAGFDAGTQTLLDILTAEQNLYQAKSNLANDQYQYLLNTLQLKQAAGILKGADVVALNRWLQ